MYRAFTTPFIVLLTLMTGCSMAMDSVPERSAWSRSGPPAPCSTSDTAPKWDTGGAVALGVLGLTASRSDNGVEVINALATVFLLGVG